MTDQVIKGSCMCGDVSYKVSGTPLRMAQCHCVDCRKASGTGHMSWAFFKEDQIELLGEVREYASVADSGNTNTRAFCPTCGARLFGRNSARPGVRSIAVGTADDSSWFKAQIVVYTKDQPVWDESARDVPRFEAMPPPT